MTVNCTTRGYGHEVYEVNANNNEVLTENTVITELKKKAGFFFDYHIQYLNDTSAMVKIYID